MEGTITMEAITVMGVIITVDADIEGDTTTITDTDTIMDDATGHSLDITDTIEMPMSTKGIPVEEHITITKTVS
jgi:hypothetical protein